MKLLMPIFQNLPIHTGGNFRNAQLALGLSQPTPLKVSLLKDFSVVGERLVDFAGAYQKRFLLNELFSDSELKSAGIAIAEFDITRLTETDKKILHLNLFEVECLFASQNSQSYASVLYDLIADKKPQHQYTPILHNGHSGLPLSVSGSETYALLINYRPAYLKASTASQKMEILLKNSMGELSKKSVVEIEFNQTSLFSFSEMFQEFGGYKIGDQMIFRGGESQFAIFTLFFNHQTQALGIEHSLPPPYYCSGVFKPESRKAFYKNAFPTLEIK